MQTLPPNHVHPSKPDSLCLPEGYVSRDQASYYEDAAANLIYQPNVYALAAHLCHRGQISRVIDIGCGQGHAVSRHFRPEQVVGIDIGKNLRIAAEKMPAGQFYEQDLERPFDLPPELARDAVVVCSDVVEHLKNPLPLVQSLARLHKVAPFVLVSTPDRERARGLQHMGPPGNVAHIREWTLAEFGRLLAREGFDTPYLGYTINTDHHRWKSTSLALGGSHATLAPAAPKRVLAIVSCYNDIDVIEACAQHLAVQGVQAWFVDNWSTDGTFEKLQAMAARHPQTVVSVERYPQQGPLDHYDWRGILQRKEEIALQTDFDWYLHHDSDELRYAPTTQWTLAQAISRIDALGYNAIDHTVLDFRPVDDSYAPGEALAAQFRHFEFGRRQGHFSQVKGWKKQDTRIDLHSTGGHEARFAHQKIYPLKFELAHYSLRSPSQAAKKLLAHRLPRIGVEQQKYGWHGHLDQAVAQAHERKFLWAPHELLVYNPSQTPAEYLVERLSGLDLQTKKDLRPN